MKNLVKIMPLIFGLIGLQTELIAKWNYDSWDTLRVTGASGPYENRCIKPEMQYGFIYAWPTLYAKCKVLKDSCGDDKWCFVDDDGVRRRRSSIKQEDCPSGEIHACNDGTLHCGPCND